jgi:hypothetical protein
MLRFNQLEHRWAEAAALLGPGGTGQARLILVGRDQIKQSKGYILCVFRERIGCDETSLFSCFSVDRGGPKVPQRADPPLAYHLFRSFMHGGKHTTNPRRCGFVGHGAVGDREMRFLDKSVTIDLQKDVIVPCRRTAFEWRVDQGLKNVPDLFPALAQRLAQGPRVLCSKHRALGVVVDGDVLRSPPQ